MKQEKIDAATEAFSAEVKKRTAFETGTVVRLKHTPPNDAQGRTFTYAAVYAVGRWFITGTYGATILFGSDSPSNATFFDVVSKHMEAGTMKVHLATRFKALS